MKRQFALLCSVVVVVAVAALVARSWAFQSAAPIMIAKSVVGQTPLPNVTLLKPGKTIVTQVPVAFQITETVDDVTHTTQYLLGPNPGSSDPAKGWFILESEEPPVFYLDYGYVYVVHTKNPGGGSPTAENTRPRVRTRRFVAAGEGTILLAQVSSELDRSFAIESKTDVTALMTAGEVELTQGHYCTAAENGELSGAIEIEGNPEPEQLVGEVYDAAESFNMETP